MVTKKTSTVLLIVAALGTACGGSEADLRVLELCDPCPASDICAVDAADFAYRCPLPGGAPANWICSGAARTCRLLAWQDGCHALVDCG